MTLDYRSLLIREWGEEDYDPSHDLGHIDRVVETASFLARKEEADFDVILPAAWFHDIVNLGKDHPKREKASLYSADRAIFLLCEHGYEFKDKMDGIHHAIHAHSFSANIVPETIEAQIIQDADRLDALGSIGIMRTFTVSGMLKRPMFHSDDPFAEHRSLDDQQFALDHFEEKLFKIGTSLNTRTARLLAGPKIKLMRQFMDQLRSELMIPQAARSSSAA